MKGFLWLVIIVLVILGAFYYFKGGESSILPAPEVQVGEDGSISGNYAIADIMNLSKPYTCRFEKTDGTSDINGTIHTDGQNVYGEFKIKTGVEEVPKFNSFLIIKNGESYTWTSLQDIGYKSSAAQSASTSASPQDQAQIVGLKDKLPYHCELWQDTNASLFEVPDWVSFSELTN